MFNFNSKTINCLKTLQNYPLKFFMQIYLTIIFRFGLFFNTTSEKLKLEFAIKAIFGFLGGYEALLFAYSANLRNFAGI